MDMSWKSGKVQQVGTEDGYGLKGLFYLDPLVEAMDYTIPKIYLPSVIKRVSPDLGQIVALSEFVFNWKLLVWQRRN